MHVLMLALLVWVLVSYGIGALWVWGHRQRPDAELHHLPATKATSTNRQLAG